MSNLLIEGLFDLFERSGALNMEFSNSELSLNLSRQGAALVSVAAETGLPVSSRSAVQSAPQTQTQTASLSGNFFRSSAPDQPPYVEAGMWVQEGQVLGLIETMKILNEVEAQCAGRVVSFAIANGESVQAGQPLIIIEPMEAPHV